MSEIAQIIAAIGTVIVAALAIWGDKVRSIVAGPKIRIRLREARGNLTTRANGTRTVYYHIAVTNARTWSPARNLIVRLIKIETMAADRRFQPERLVHSLQFTWANPQFHEISPTVTSSDMCDFGFIDEGSEGFVPSMYVMPNDFEGIVQAEETRRFTIDATADNYHSKTPLVLEVAWDGTWTADTEQLMRHLVIREI